MTADELETRFYFIGTVCLRIEEARLWCMPYNLFADLWALYLIHNGRAKQEVEEYIDDIMD